MTGRARGTTIEQAGTLCFLLFIFAGYYKAAGFLSAIPIDLTLLFAAGTIAFCALALWRQRRLPAGLLLLTALFAAMAIGLHPPEGWGSYATQKELRLFSLTAVAAFAPLLLLRGADQRRLFVVATAVLGLLMAVIALANSAQAGAYQRAGIFNTTPLHLARGGGFACLILCLLFWQRRLPVLFFAPALAVALAGLLLSGTRGPLVALLASGVVMAALCLAGGADRTRVWGTLLAASGFLVCGVAYLYIADTYTGRHLVELLSGQLGDTESVRWALWQQTAVLIAENPFGIGWGHMAEFIHVTHNGIAQQHSHNILLEITLEAGWPAGALFAAFTAMILLRLFRQSSAAVTATSGRPNSDALVAFVALAYWLACAAFSGDVNDNRPFWAMFGLALATLASSPAAPIDSVDSRSKPSSIANHGAAG